MKKIVDTVLVMALLMTSVPGLVEEATAEPPSAVAPAALPNEHGSTAEDLLAALEEQVMA